MQSKSPTPSFTDPVASPEVLTAEEKSQLHQAEQIVEKGLTSFLEVGMALADIRDKRLYRQTSKTFEEYLYERWGILRAHGNRLIRAANAVAEMKKLEPGIASLIPKKERVVRQLLSYSGAADQIRILKKGKELAGDKEMGSAQIKAGAEALGRGETKPVKAKTHPKDSLSSILADLKSVLAEIKATPGLGRTAKRLAEVIHKLERRGKL